ncbi:MAG: nitrite reductase [Rhodospirillales bacterium]|jgi:sulfite reductase (NADPH) hemoprotein beta-component|nr:nitrite reductase [Rhodospirillales bacterium]
MAAQVITANRLVDGAVVYLSADGQWVQSLEEASVAEGEAAAAALVAAGDRAVAGRLVVAPYLIEVDRGPEGIQPRRYRERLRATGPSIPFGGGMKG